jgi:glycosyltransferase involved in cell wall biosynthesis
VSGVLRAIVMRAVQAGLAVVALPILIAVALAARAVRQVRRLAGLRPRTVWGSTPIVNIKYWSAALRAAGYPSRTIVTHVYPANDRRDFDFVRDDWLDGRPRLALVADYVLFARVLWSADVLSAFFDGGFLKSTPLARWEVGLLHLAGGRLVVLPFGSDIAVPGHLGPTEAAFRVHYGYVLDEAEAIRRRVDRLCASADLVMKTLQVGYLPRHDAFWSHGLAVDTEWWAPSEASPECGETVVVHAPNHRQLKGTDAVIAAVEHLQREGLTVRLELLEGRSNEDVRSAIRTADIAVDQLLTGYGLFAVEAMAAGLPVISNLRWMPDAMRSAPSLTAVPIVDADESDVTARLRELVVDRDLRLRLGAESRRFALAYHSYEATRRVWVAVVEHVWNGAPLPEGLAPITSASSEPR